MKKYEYKIEYVSFGRNTITEKEWLQFQGRSGWELCAVANGGHYFKREIEKDKENGI